MPSKASLTALPAFDLLSGPCCLTTAALLLLSDQCCLTTASPLLPHYCCLITAASPLLPHYYCRTTAASLLPDLCCLCHTHTVDCVCLQQRRALLARLCKFASPALKWYFEHRPLEEHMTVVQPAMLEGLLWAWGQFKPDVTLATKII